jgi:replicative DNA helicase
MASYFGDSSLKHLFEAAHDLWISGKPIDPVTVLHAAGDAHKETVRSCMDAAPVRANVDEYLHILRDEARLYQIRMAASELSWVKSMEDALDAYERMGQLLRETDTIEDVSWEEMVGSYLDRMSDPAPPNYLTWGIPQLDETLCVSPGDFCVLAADSSVGKTALALQFAYHMASHGRKTLFFSLETPKEKLEDRLMAEKQVAAIPMQRTKKKALTNADYLRAGDTGVKSEKVPLRVIRRAETLPQIQNRIIMHNADVVFIDYLQIIRHKGSSRFEIVTEIAMELHRMANRLGVTIVALSQVTPPQDGEITIQDLRESGQIKNDAEIILLMMKDKTFPGARKLKIGKDKDGATNRSLLLSFDPQHMTFSYAKRKEPAQVPGQGAPMYDLDDDEGGENPFE